MCRDKLKLPTSYTADSVLGVTKARERWTIYFNDGARFTQCHSDPSNLGFKDPEPHHFFENVPDWVLDELWSEAATKTGLREGQIPGAETRDAYFDLICDLPEIKSNIQSGKIVPPTRPSPKDDEDPHTLIEVKQAEGGVSVHPSGDALEPIRKDDAQRLLDEVRSRSTQTVPNKETGNWCFAEDDGEPAAAAADSTGGGP
ncbi:MAG: hypothetical protein AAGB11_19855 [Pseudomonadota bacterium]